ncbi:LOW QUALITY PROTEIN: hypothetical protein SETIT_7G017300v2 [Setaria italica]|uniref:Uncharacterized protein n=1 Tax=Setaria italica TaxID=4555 RepID=A0A368RQW2_SETIT|nr:LOW QUALITY PROTEIN: hypothetical protein SETIT_7G017300v2 [Setaria italica]
MVSTNVIDNRCRRPASFPGTDLLPRLVLMFFPGGWRSSSPAASAASGAWPQPGVRQRRTPLPATGTSKLGPRRRRGASRRRGERWRAVAGVVAEQRSKVRGGGRRPAWALSGGDAGELGGRYHWRAAVAEGCGGAATAPVCGPSQCAQGGGRAGGRRRGAVLHDLEELRRVEGVVRLRAGGDGANVGRVEAGVAARLEGGGVGRVGGVDGEAWQAGDALRPAPAPRGVERGDEHDDHGLAGGAEDDAGAAAGGGAVHEAGRQAVELGEPVKREDLVYGWKPVALSPKTEKAPLPAQGQQVAPALARCRLASFPGVVYLILLPRHAGVGDRAAPIAVGDLRAHGGV